MTIDIEVQKRQKLWDFSFGTDSDFQRICLRGKNISLFSLHCRLSLQVFLAVPRFTLPALLGLCHVIKTQLLTRVVENDLKAMSYEEFRVR